MGKRTAGRKRQHSRLALTLYKLFDDRLALNSV